MPSMNGEGEKMKIEIENESNSLQKLWESDEKSFYVRNDNH